MKRLACRCGKPITRKNLIKSFHYFIGDKKTKEIRHQCGSCKETIILETYFATEVIFSGSCIEIEN